MRWGAAAPPIQCQGTGERIVLWRRAKAFSNGIQPDVPGDGIRGHWFAQDVIVIARLPKPVADFLLIVKRGLLLEQGNESDEVTSLDHALHQEVKVVGHHAIGMNGETLFGGGLQQFCNKPMTEGFIREDMALVVAT
jgi:hypothetical protein